MVTVADEAWIATALLHREQPEREGFTVAEILDRARLEAVQPPLRPGVGFHVTYHAVASKPPKPGRTRLLSEVRRGVRRLFRTGDDFHPERTGRTVPNAADIPERYRYLLEWYRTAYDQPASGVPRRASIPNEEGAVRAALSRRFGVPLARGAVQRVPKQFAFVSADGSIVGDTASADVAEQVWLLEKTGATTKVLVFPDESTVPGEWLRRYGHLAADIRFYCVAPGGDLVEVGGDVPAGAWSRLSTSAFARDWDSPEDSVYDELPAG